MLSSDNCHYGGIPIHNVHKIHAVKSANRSRILNLLYFNGPMSRKIIAEHTQLTAASISQLTGELIREGVLSETMMRVPSVKAGRSQQLLDINYEVLSVAGIQIRDRDCEITLARLDATVLDTAEIASPDISLAEIAGVIRSMSAKHSVDNTRTVCTGVSVKGIVDNKAGISVDSYGRLKKGTDLAGVLGDCLKMPITVENNVRALLHSVSILWRQQPLTSTVLIKYGPGVGGAFSVNENIYIGTDCKALEIGHLGIVNGTRRCVCGKTGCLETEVSDKALVCSAKTVFSEWNTPTLYALCDEDPSHITAAFFWQAFESEDPGIETIAHNAINHLAMAVANTIVTLNPESVIVASEYFSCSRLRSLMEERILKNAPSDNRRLIFTTDGGELESKGAVSAAIRYVLSSGGYITKDYEHDERGAL